MTSHVFDYGQKGAADQMQTTFEKIVQHVGTIYGHNISNELLNRSTVMITEPTYSETTLNKHQAATLQRDTQEVRMIAARSVEETALRELVAEGKTNAHMLLAVLLTKVEEAAVTAATTLSIRLEGSEKAKYENEWRSYRERVT